jgi:hypothetical protein
MKNSELQELLAQYPDDMPIKLLVDHCDVKAPLIEFTDENVLHTSETAYVDTDADLEDWDTEDGKIELGDGQQFLLINPMII